MVTTTIAAVLGKIEAVLESLAPAAAPVGVPFRRAGVKQLGIKEWCTRNAFGSEVFRKFDSSRSGPRADPGLMDPSASFVNQTITVTVAYPARLPALYGRDDLDDMEDIVESDARQIRDAIFSPSNLADAGHQASIVTIQDLDRSNPDVWFQDFTVEVKFFVSQTL